MTTFLSQDALYGPILTNEQQYRHELAPIEELTREEERELLTRIRAGDIQARNDLLTHLLPITSRVAAKYAYTYSWASPRLSYLDMVEDASVNMLEVLNRALTKENPVSYLLGVACQEMRHRCYHAAKERVEESLNAPIDDENECALHEFLPSPTELAPYARCMHDYTPLYEAIDALPPMQRTIILRRYGIHEHALETPSEIARDLHISPGRLGYHDQKACATLYFDLRTSYLAYVQDNIPLTERTISYDAMQGQTASSEQQRKLDEAYAALQTSGQKITVRGICQASHVDVHVAQTYAYEKRKGQPQDALDRHQRLDEAYAALQTSGQKITVKTLAHAAHVTDLVASMYLKQREPERMLTAEQRLSEAYAALQTSGQKITVKTLARAAYVDEDAASMYLKQREPERMLTAEQRLSEAYTTLQTSGQKITGKMLACAAHVDKMRALAYLRERRLLDMEISA